MNRPWLTIIVTNPAPGYDRDSHSTLYPGPVMTTSAFLIVILAIGVLYLILFNRMEKRQDRRDPRGENPIRRWFTGKHDDED